jgi:hypothetical protein
MRFANEVRQFPRLHRGTLFIDSRQGVPAVPPVKKNSGVRTRAITPSGKIPDAVEDADHAIKERGRMVMTFRH